jgi:hypothetical protein
MAQKTIDLMGNVPLWHDAELMGQSPGRLRWRNRVSSPLALAHPFGDSQRQQSQSW